MITKKYASPLASIALVLFFLAGCGSDAGLVTGGEGDCSKADIQNGSARNCVVIESTVNLTTDDVFSIIQPNPQGITVSLTAQDLNNPDTEVFFLHLILNDNHTDTTISTGEGPSIIGPNGSNDLSYKLGIEYGDYKAGTTFENGIFQDIGSGSITIHEISEEKFRATINSSTLETHVGGDRITISGEVVITK